MPKEKNSLVYRANKLTGNDKHFEVETKGEEVSIFCNRCQSKFKVDSIHLNTQFKSHISSVKHKKSCEKSLLQPSISGAIVTANAKEKKDDTYALK